MRRSSEDVSKLFTEHVGSKGLLKERRPGVQKGPRDCLVGIAGHEEYPQVWMHGYEKLRECWSACAGHHDVG